MTNCPDFRENNHKSITSEQLNMNDKEKINRAGGLLVIEVINSNPNGDPDRESDPRQRPDKLGEISPVSFKRKCRDIVDIKSNEWPELKEQVAKHLEIDPLNDDDFQILERRGRDREQIELEVYNGTFIKKYWDARVFGNTFLEKKEDIKKRLKDPKSALSKANPNKEVDELFKQLRLNIKSGVIQFGMGLSIKPINIRRNSQTNKPGVEEGTDQGYAPLGYRFVPQATYTMPFFINPAGAFVRGINGQTQTVCWKRDVELLLRLIPQAYPLNPSSIRPCVRVVLAHYLEHNNLLGSFSDLELLRLLTPVAKQKDEPDAPELPFPSGFNAWTIGDAKRFLKTHFKRGDVQNKKSQSPNLGCYRELVSGIELTQNDLNESNCS
jgi:CRISPR-associated protein Csd2